MKPLTLPISNEAILDLHKGDPVALSGVMMLGRDAAHKWMHETFIKKSREPQGDDLEVYEAIKRENRAAASVKPEDIANVAGTPTNRSGASKER